MLTNFPIVDIDKTSSFDMGADKMTVQTKNTFNINSRENNWFLLPDVSFSWIRKIKHPKSIWSAFSVTHHLKVNRNS